MYIITVYMSESNLFMTLGHVCETLPSIYFKFQIDWKTPGPIRIFVKGVTILGNADGFTIIGNAAQ